MHIPVLKEELIEVFEPRKEEKVIDATLGAGGHAEVMLKQGVNLLGIERDSELLKKARKRLSEYPQKKLVQGNYKRIKEISKENGFNFVSYIYFDLGACLWHFKKSERGFSFHKDEPLDMRFSPDSRPTAKDILNNYSKEKLAKIFNDFGQEKFAENIASEVVAAREKSPLRTTGDLVRVIKRAVPGEYDQGRKHPARRTFQALRIVVNEELENLEQGLAAAEMLLKKEGKLAAITYHSLEDKAVKRFYQQNPRLRVLEPNFITPSQEELRKNSAARSAKLRVSQKTV
jgi:16S rRNA (cytosine1402-N4)-methyltransferase